MSSERVHGNPGPSGPRFIPGVYNFCDRWCERCRFVTRCVIGVMHVRREEARARGEDLATVGIPVARDAREYGMIASRVATALHAELSGRGDPVVLSALDAIARRALCIGAKTWRAVGGQTRAALDQRDVDDDDVGLQMDGNGSAKIVRLMVAESRECWSVLMQVGRATADGLPVRMVERLDRLDQALAVRFPRAMDFRRPGFDEEP